MVPAATALAQTAAAPKLRTGFFYIPHGAIMHNTSHGPAMDQMDAQRRRRRFQTQPDSLPAGAVQEVRDVFRNLENAGQRGLGSHAQSGDVAQRHASDTGRARAHMAPTLDQVIAKVIGQDTPLPSLEVSSETIVQSAAGGGGSYTTLSFRDAESPLPMEYNPRKVFLQLFGEGDTPEERAFISRQTDSILDLITDRTKKLQAKLGNGDRAVLDGYLETVRESSGARRRPAASNLSSLKIPNAPVGRTGGLRRAGEVDVRSDSRSRSRPISRASCLTSWSRKARTGPTTTSAFRMRSIPCRTTPTIWKESTSW